ncbi:MAG: bifunctional 5,10-methylenetetrahydrofolate dehydrogenase/5,10-methenyltetrahydrofolate cyclohydrolase [Vicinamibacterales bacterium]
MPARLLDGTAVGQAIRASVKPEVEAFTRDAGRPPGIALVLVGNDGGSELYVGSKLKSAGESGIRADLERLPASASVDDLLRLVDRLNRSDVHDAILVQSPLPKEMGPDAERRVFDAIDPDKDVDGFHPTNVGRLVQGRSALVACTPSGIIEMLDRSGIEISGKRAVVIGRSDIVGKPMALLLLNRHATVTICHSRTKDLPSVAREADILVAALGRPVFVTKDFVKPGATVIDVGTTPVSDRVLIESLFPEGHRRRAAFEKRGSLVLGDVHPEVEDVAGALTPVPGGVGPLTIAMLLKNTVTAARERFAKGRR